MANEATRGYVEHRCSSARELFDELIHGSHRAPRVDAIYRGQGNADHRLVPRALRIEPGSASALCGINAGAGAEDVVFAELRALQLFVEACDRAGLRIPGDGPLFREHLTLNGAQDAFRHPRLWPFDVHRDAWALAQHHGLPTRLLDWSRTAIVAMYFAATSCLVDRENPGDLAVWVLLDDGRPTWGERLILVEVPGVVSPNLAAQVGVFTLAQERTVRRGRPLTVPCVEEVIAEGCRTRFPMNPPPLRKHTLPRIEAPLLLDLCERCGIAAETLFPGYDGATRAAVERLRRYATVEGRHD